MVKFNIKNWQKNLMILILVFITTLCSIQLFAKTSFKYNSFSFNLRTKIGANGGTNLVIPPVGQLFLKTHLTPWQLIVTLDEINFVKLEQELNSLPTKDQWLGVFQAGVTKAIIRLFSLMFLYGLLGTALLMLFFRILPSNKLFWYSLLTSFLIVAIMIGSTVLTYDSTAIERPQYQGVLASAPWAMNLISIGLDNIEIIGENLKKISQGLPMLYQQAGKIQNIGAFQTYLAVLHVSDIHNNLATFDFISELVTNFKINLIIDTGDLTDYGTPIEAEIIDKIAELQVPYVFVPGNHDSPLIIERLQKLKNVKVITDGTLKISGLLIAGKADPAAKDNSAEVPTTEELEQARDEFCEKVTALSEPPNIVAVHNRILAEPLIGKVPLLLHGHTHKYAYSITDGTVVNNAGTTGAAGLRGLTPKGVPYSAAIFYWNKDEQDQLYLQAVDSIKINGVEGKLTVERHTFPSNPTLKEDEKAADENQ